MKRETLSDYIKKNSMPLLLQALSLFALIANLWLASKLSPLGENLALITQRVNANEMLDTSQHPSFVTHEQIKAEITNRLDRLESKMDRLIERH